MTDTTQPQAAPDAREAAELQTLLAEHFMWCRPPGASLLGWARAALAEFAPKRQQARNDAAEARVRTWIERLYRGDNLSKAFEALKAENEELRAELARNPVNPHQHPPCPART